MVVEIRTSTIRRNKLENVENNTVDKDNSGQEVGHNKRVDKLFKDTFNMH